MPLNRNDKRIFPDPDKQRIYLAKMDSTPPVYKIGVSHDPERRSRHFRWGPWPVSIIHVIESDDAGGVEGLLHHRFCDRHLQYEWFALTPNDVDLLLAIQRIDSLADMPAHLRPMKNARFVQRKRRHRKPTVYKVTPATRPIDPIHAGIEMTTEKAIAVTERLFSVRVAAGVDLGDFHMFGFSTDDFTPGISKGYKERWPFRSHSAMQIFERCQSFVSAGRIHVYALNLRMGVIDLLGEHVDILPMEYRTNLSLPESYPADWKPDYRAWRDREIERRYNERKLVQSREKAGRRPKKPDNE